MTHEIFTQQRPPFTPHTSTPPSTDEAAALLPKPSTTPSQDGYTRITSRTGYIFVFISSLGFSCMMLLQHVAETKYGLPPASALLIRGVFQLGLALIALPFMTDVRVQLSLPARTMTWLFIRGFLGAIALFGYSIALSLIPAGDAAAIFFTCPVFTMLFARLLVGEPITRFALFAALLSVVGGIMVSSPTSDGGHISKHDRLIGSVLALLAAVFAGISYTIIRKLGSSIHFLSSVISLGVLILPVTLCMGGFFNPFNIPVDLRSGVAIMSVSGVCAFIGQCTLSRGLQLSRAGPALLLRNIDVPLIYIASVIFLNEVPSVSRALGATLIVMSAVLIAARKVR